MEINILQEIYKCPLQKASFAENVQTRQLWRTFRQQLRTSASAAFRNPDVYSLLRYSIENF